MVYIVPFEKRIKSNAISDHEVDFDQKVYIRFFVFISCYTLFATGFACFIKMIHYFDVHEWKKFSYSSL